MRALLLTGMLVAGVMTRDSVPEAAANDNRVAAGTLTNGALDVRIEVARVRWHPGVEDGPGLEVLAFAESGKAPSIPGPLIRVPTGTLVHARIRNPLTTDTLFVHGLASRGGPEVEPLLVPPGAERATWLLADHPGSYFYWAATSRRAFDTRFQEDALLSGALIVDPPGGSPPDRVLLISLYSDTLDADSFPTRLFLAINGRSWPRTERLTYALGDSIRWRVLNASADVHPMHLHGFYFRVDGRGDNQLDSVYAPTHRQMAVTERMMPGTTMNLVWSPDRPGGWVFHCHLNFHTTAEPPVDQKALFAAIPDHHADPDHHVERAMGGLIMAISIPPPAGYALHDTSRRRLRLFIQSDSVAGDTVPRFAYVLQQGEIEPAPDSVQVPGPTLVLHRGEPTLIEVTNRSSQATAIHWHGIELESYFDGVVGLGGVAGMATPSIRPGASFDVRMTPPRAGSFMYHTHINDLSQQQAGLYGAIIVLEPGATWDPEHDRVFMLSTKRDSLVSMVNGSRRPDTLDLIAGDTYRFRLMNITIHAPLHHFALTRAGQLLEWRLIAKDGFTLPPSQRGMRPADQAVAMGETVDVEFTPDEPGDYDLEMRPGGERRTIAVPLRVRQRPGADAHHAVPTSSRRAP